jgi:hypothetical protein
VAVEGLLPLQVESSNAVPLGGKSARQSGRGYGRAKRGFEIGDERDSHRPEY